MKLIDWISIFLNKIISVIGITLGIVFTPMQYYFCGLKFSYSNFLILLIPSALIMLFFWYSLLKTNNPVTRLNPLSINKNWRNKMKHSMNEDPGQLFRLDKPTADEILQANRDKRLKELGIK